jgi:hypothetical protein
MRNPSRFPVNYDAEAEPSDCRIRPMAASGADGGGRTNPCAIAVCGIWSVLIACAQKFCTRGCCYSILTIIAVIVIIGLLAELRAWLAADRISAAVNSSSPSPSTARPSTYLWDG